MDWEKEFSSGQEFHHGRLDFFRRNGSRRLPRRSIPA
jgi:hypothetical protein